MNHRRLLRFALTMWAVPLVAASAVMLGFLFLRAPVFVASGMVLLVAGGLCLSAGVIAVIAILATRNTFLESPRRLYKKRAFVALGLLLLNLPVAVLYTVIGGALLEPSAIEAAVSPSGRYLAETIHLGEHERPPYGMGVTLRPQPGRFRTQARSLVFAGDCLDGPTLRWENHDRLVVTCAGARRIERRLERFREATIRYRFEAVPVRPRRNSK